MEAQKAGASSALPVPVIHSSILTAAKAAVSDEDALKLRIIEEETVKKKPGWMKYYRQVSYVFYGCIVTFSWFYLIYVGIYQAHPRMQIQYVAVVRFLEYNSYSILAPLLCPIFMGMLAYQVKKEIALKEGDFFGVLGAFLFLALMMFHDAYGMYNQVQSTRDYNRRTSRLDPPPEKEGSRNDLAWQYAWSTKPSCARRHVRLLNYQHESDKKHGVRERLVDKGAAKSRALEDENARQSAVMVQQDCKGYHDDKARAKTRPWMTNLQNEFKCCGPYGFNRWKERFSDERRTGCNKEHKRNGDIPSCYDPLMNWLNGIFITTMWIMIVQGLLYILAMFLAMTHHIAMKYEKSQVAKSHSLLELSDNPMERDGLWWRDSRPMYKPPVVGRNIPEEETDSKGGPGSSETKGDLRAHTTRSEKDKYAPILKNSKPQNTK